MFKTRRRFTAGFRARATLDALACEQYLSGLAAKDGVHPNQVSR